VLGDVGKELQALWSDIEPELSAFGEKFHICGQCGVKDRMDESLVEIEHEELFFVLSGWMGD
jgi:hypothetical protein